VIKRQPFPSDIALAMMIFPMSMVEVIVGDYKVSLVWLAFFPVAVWPDSRPDRYFFRWQGIKQSTYFGLSMGVIAALFSLVPLRAGFINVAVPEVGFWPQAFSILQRVVFTELAFRGLILGSLVYRGVPDRIAVLVQGSLYAILLLIGFLYSGQLAALIWFATIGLIAGWITLRTRNIAGTILMHLMVYGTGLLLSYYY
jgi:membrane protease YdiL (CAAX protease family)